MTQQQPQYDYLASLSPPPPSAYLHTTVHDSPRATLWMGDLEPWMDEPYVRQLWVMMGEHVIVKLIRDKRTGVSAGYAFVEFNSVMAAQSALATLHGARMPNSHRMFRLNWASGGGIHDKKEDRAPEFSLFVGDLGGDVDETFLLTLFRQRYPSCHSAKVMTDPVSGLPRGYGFVRFLNASDQQAALVEMNGVLCGHRPMRVSLATPKNSGPNARYHHLALQAPALVQQPTDPANTTVFVGGLPSPVTEDELRCCFAPFGEIIYVKIPPNKGCGFVQYVSRQSAELAIEQMNGFQIRSSRIRLSWGRSQNDKALAPGATVAVTNSDPHYHSPPSSLFRYPQQGSTTSNALMTMPYKPKSPPLAPGSVDTFGSFSPPGHGLLRSHPLSPLPSVHHHGNGGALDPITDPTTAWLLSDVSETTTSTAAPSTWGIDSMYSQ